MNASRKNAIYAFAAVAALTASACGSSDSDNADAAGAEPDTAQVIAPVTEAPVTEAPVTNGPARDDIVGCETTGPDGNGGLSGIKVIVENQASEPRDYFVEGTVTSADDSSIQDTFIASITQAQPGALQTEPARLVEYDGEPFVDENFVSFSEEATTGTTCTIVNVEETDFGYDDSRSDELAASCLIAGNNPDGTFTVEATVSTETAGLTANARVAITRDGTTVETFSMFDFDNSPVGDVTMENFSVLVADSADVECKVISATEVVF
ncbi:MAG: hypothetical protein P8O03_13375 [Ilumatobacter sp.]|nr:hypothetical protein [Ilumatobacter sp.]